MSKAPLVIELFKSLQGEGLFIGRPSLFIRLAGCNLRCLTCDTGYAWTAAAFLQAKGFPRIPWEKVDDALNEESMHVVLTGGEPLLWPVVLLRLLQHKGVRTLTIETNGTLAAPEWALADKRVWWSVSPKGPWFNDEYPWKGAIPNLQDFDQTGRAYFKVVVRTADHMRWWLQRYATFGLEGTVVFQPDNCELDDLHAYMHRLVYLAAEFADIRPWWVNVPVRILPQLHFLMYGRRRGV